MTVERPAVSRRAMLLAGSAGLLAACSGNGAAPVSRSAPVVPTPRLGLSPSGATTPVQAVEWSRLARHVRGSLHRPGSSGYDTARLVQNPRYDDNHPLAVLSVADATDVATAIAFAGDHALPVAIRSGGHSYSGYSAGGAPGTGVPRSLVLDCRALDAVSLTGSSATIGTGAALATVYDTLGRRGRAIAGGSCATVGIGGLTQGGGVGVLTRAMGLTCDAVSAMQVVTADGSTRRIDADHDPDLFWALRGGGGGHLGVVTSFTLVTRAAPSLHTFYLQWPLTQAVEVIAAWQGWAPHADRRLWSTLKGLGGSSHPSGPVLLLSGTWLGPASALDVQLAGLLNHTPAPAVRAVRTRSYFDAMMSYAGCAGIPVDRCHTGPGGALDRQAFAATSHVGYDELSGAGITTLLDRVQDAQSSGLPEAGISMDALGGRVADLAPDATAFVHRTALMTVQYTATCAPRQADRAAAYVRRFRASMLPSWGNHAYVNYADQAVANHRTAYFGNNAPRLAAARRTYDPAGFFTQPQGF